MLPVVRLELRSLRRPHLDESGVRTRPRSRLHHRLDRRARRRRRARIRARLRTQQHRFPDRRGARRRDRLDGRPPAHPAPGPEVLAVWTRGVGTVEALARPAAERSGSALARLENRLTHGGTDACPNQCSPAQEQSPASAAGSVPEPHREREPCRSQRGPLGTTTCWPCNSNPVRLGSYVSRARARREIAGFRPGFWPQGQLRDPSSR